MDTTVVKLNSLTNPVGAATENHNLLGLGQCDFVVPTVVGGIVVRSIRFKLGSAGVDESITWDELVAFAFSSDFVLSSASQMSYLAVRESEGLGAD